MRLAVVATLLALAAMAAPTLAQDSGTQANPVPWTVGVDEHGLVGDTAWNFTKGDWVKLEVDSIDEAGHTLTIPDLGVTLQVAPYGEASKTFMLEKSGTFTVQDQPTGDTGTVQVVDADVVDYENGLVDETGGVPPAATTSRGSAFVEIGIVVGVLAAAVLLVRRA